MTFLPCDLDALCDLCVLTPPHMPVWPAVFLLPFSHGSRCCTCRAKETRAQAQADAASQNRRNVASRNKRHVVKHTSQNVPKGLNKKTKRHQSDTGSHSHLLRFTVHIHSKKFRVFQTEIHLKLQKEGERLPQTYLEVDFIHHLVVSLQLVQLHLRAQTRTHIRVATCPPPLVLREKQ